MATGAYSRGVAAAAPDSAAALVTRLQTRDRQAWDELYTQYEPRLSRFAYRLTGNPHDAADLVQETFLRVLPRLERLDPSTLNLSAYLFTTAKNLFLKQAQSRRRLDLPGEVPEPAGERPIEDEPERLTQLHRQQEEVRAANAALPPRQRLVLALRELEERSYAEIGDIVGLNENAVAQLISRARDNLRHELRLAQVDRSQLSEACQALLPALSAHLDGRLKSGERDRVLAHLEACPDCQAVLVSMEEARRRYRALLPPLLGAGELKSRLDGELDGSGYWQVRRRPLLRGTGRRRLVLAGAAGATAALLAAAGYVLAGAGSSPGRGATTGGGPNRLAVAPPLAGVVATTAPGVHNRRTPARARRSRAPLTTTLAAAPPKLAATAPAATTPVHAQTTITTTTAAPATTAASAALVTTTVAAAALSKPKHSSRLEDSPPPPSTARLSTAADHDRRRDRGPARTGPGAPARPAPRGTQGVHRGQHRRGRRRRVQRSALGRHELRLRHPAGGRLGQPALRLRRQSPHGDDRARERRAG